MIARWSGRNWAEARLAGASSDRYTLDLVPEMGLRFHASLRASDPVAWSRSLFDSEQSGQLP